MVESSRRRFPGCQPPARRDPHPTYTFKQGGKTRGRQLHNQEEEAELYRRQIEAYRRYQELTAELVQVSQALADLEVAGDLKKNSRR